MDDQGTTDDVSSATISALLSYSSTAQTSQLQDILPKFSSPLKTNFENLNLWLRFGLTLSLSRQSPQSALQAFNECMRIDQNDPLPAMLAAKLSLKDIDDPENGLKFANEAIKRCQRLVPSPSQSQQQQQPLETSNKYCKNISPLLSKCYLLASIMHAHIYEREPESIKQFKTSNLKASLHYLDLALETYSNDYLVYFHKAMHEARQRSYPAAIDNIRQAIKLNPHHMPSMQLLILSLSALKLYDEALVLCESTLHECEDNLLLLYIKCNLEQCLVETKGYKIALNTAQQMLKCIRRSTTTPATVNQPNELIPTTNATTTTNTSSTNNTNAVTPTTALTAGTAPTTSLNPATETKQPTNLFAADTIDKSKRHGFHIGELSVWLLVAEIFVKIGAIDDAEMCVDEGAAHANGALSHQVMFMRGLISKAKNNLIEAKTFFQSCLALCPRHANALQQIAHVHYLLGNHSTAEKFLKDSLDVDSDCYKTWHYLSLVFIEQSLHDKANECVKKATVLEESSPVISLSTISRLTLE